MPLVTRLAPDPVNMPEVDLLLEHCRAEMARLTAAAHWRELVAECAAREDE
jgi:hypothetical protein